MRICAALKTSGTKHPQGDNYFSCSRMNRFQQVAQRKTKQVGVRIWELKVNVEKRKVMRCNTVLVLEVIGSYSQMLISKVSPPLFLYFHYFYRSFCSQNLSAYYHPFHTQQNKDLSNYSRIHSLNFFHTCQDFLVNTINSFVIRLPLLNHSPSLFKPHPFLKMNLH